MRPPCGGTAAPPPQAEPADSRQQQHGAQSADHDERADVGRWVDVQDVPRCRDVSSTADRQTGHAGRARDGRSLAGASGDAPPDLPDVASQLQVAGGDSTGTDRAPRPKLPRLAAASTTLTFGLHERVRQRYLPLAPYLARLEELSRTHAEHQTSRGYTKMVVFEFIGRTNSRSPFSSLIFDDERTAFMQEKNWRVSDVYNLDSLDDMILLAHELHANYPGVWEAMQPETTQRALLNETRHDVLYEMLPVRMMRRRKKRKRRS